MESLSWSLGQYRIRLQCGRPGFDPWVGKIPWRRKWLHPPVFLLGEFHGQKILAGYHPWGCKELDRTERPAYIPSEAVVKVSQGAQIKPWLCCVAAVWLYFLSGSAIKALPAEQVSKETRVQSLGQKDPTEEEKATCSSFSPGKSHGQRSLVGYSPWDQKIWHDWVQPSCVTEAKLLLYVSLSLHVNWRC